MATKCVKWTSSSCLECAGSAPADVVLCVPSAKLLDSNLHTLNATLTDVSTQCNQNCGTILTYTFCYDDADLAEDAVLFGSDITGVFCKNCLTQWVEDQIYLEGLDET